MSHQKTAAERLPVPVRMIERRIYLIRGHKAMLDSDLAELYQVSTGRLNEQVRRNRSRFPADFMFQLTRHEADSLRSQIATLKTGRGQHRKYLSYAFTEQGVAMLSSVLNSERAIDVNIAIMRAFVHLRRNKRLAALEKKLATHEKSFVVVFQVLDKLTQPPPNDAIGFEAKRNK